jgi:hypothetical protein
MLHLNIFNEKKGITMNLKFSLLSNDIQQYPRQFYFTTQIRSMACERIIEFF